MINGVWNKPFLLRPKIRQFKDLHELHNIEKYIIDENEMRN